MKQLLVLLCCLGASANNVPKPCFEPRRQFCHLPQSDGFCHRDSCPKGRPLSDTSSSIVNALLADFSVFDVVLVEAGAAQGPIPAGDLTRATVAEAIADDELVGIQLNGSDLVAAIEHGLHMYHAENVTDANPRVGGIRFLVNPRNEFGARIIRPQILHAPCLWKVARMDQIYTVLTTRALVEGAYRYPLGGRRLIPTGVSIVEAYWDYAQSVCHVASGHPLSSETLPRKEIRLRRKKPRLYKNATFTSVAARTRHR